MPLVSVIIPAYNRAHTIERALDSVVAQSLQDFEIIVVDDASTDNTAQVVADYGDARIRYLRHEENRFAGAARNTGMAAAEGRYVAFLDSDDAWLPDKLRRQVELLEGADRDCDCSYTGATIYFEGGLRARHEYRPAFSGDALRPYLMNKFTIWTPTFLFRRSLLERVTPFAPDLIRGEDVDFYLRILQVSRLSCVPEPMVELYLDMTKEIAAVSEQCDRDFLKRHRELINQLDWFSRRQLLARYELRIGDRYLQEGDVGRGTRKVLRALAYSPFLSPKRYAATALRYCRALTGN